MHRWTSLTRVNGVWYGVLSDDQPLYPLSPFERLPDQRIGWRCLLRLHRHWRNMAAADWRAEQRFRRQERALHWQKGGVTMELELNTTPAGDVELYYEDHLEGKDCTILIRKDGTIVHQWTLADEDVDEPVVDVVEPITDLHQFLTALLERVAAQRKTFS